MPKWNKVSQDDDAPQSTRAAPSEPPRFQPPSRAHMIEVTVRHWMEQEKELRVVLPKRAKFKHVKKAMAKALDRDDFLTGLKLMNNQGGIYTSYKDKQSIGDKRVVLARCPAELLPDGATETCLSEGEVSAEETIQPTSRTFDKIDRSRILPDAAANSAAARRVRAGGPLTRKQAISLQLELLEAFRSDDFQRQMMQLEAERQAGMPKPEFVRLREELRLSLQGKILPKYGFQDSHEGVLKMLGSFSPFLAEPDPDIEIIELGNEINELLGLSTDEGYWSSLSSQCRQLHDVPRAKARPIPPMPGMGIPGLAIANDRMGGGVFSLPSMQGFACEEHGLLGPSMFEDYEPWPPGRGRPFDLFIVGSWNDNEPTLMEWEGGIFTISMTVGPGAMEIFQLIEGKDWSQTYYPSESDAQPGDGHAVLGPDEQSEGRSWLIGSADGTVGRSGDKFGIVAAIDSSAHVVAVDWHLVF